MRIFGLGGLSVTMPHKEDVAELVDELDAAATALHSVNTVVPIGDGRLKGYSTDGAGFLASLAAQGVEVAGQACLRARRRRCGAGDRRCPGTSRRRGRSSSSTGRRERADEAAARLAGGVGVVGRAASDIADCDIVVNATSIGMGSDELPCDPAAVARRPGRGRHRLPPAAHRPARPRPAAGGARTVEGLGMLVHQAVAAAAAVDRHRPRRGGDVGGSRAGVGIARPVALT